MSDATEPIDFVITWVDGSDPAHIAKRSRYLDPSLRADATEAARFEDAGELRYCVRSILNYAPWVRKIWLVTDDQFPSSLRHDPSGKLEVVDHRTLLEARHLPTFNSMAITSRLHKIPGLAEQYVLFNDDVMLCKPTKPIDFFRRGRMLLRRVAIGISEQEGTIYRAAQINAGRILGIEPSSLFRVGHVARPFLRSLVEELESRFPEAFDRNASYRFRDPSQFTVSTLAENFAVREGRAVVITRRDWVHLTIDECAVLPVLHARSKLGIMRRHRPKMACINDFASLIKRMPAAESYVSLAAGPPIPIEAPKKKKLLPIPARSIVIDYLWLTISRILKYAGKAKRVLFASRRLAR